MCNKTWHSKDSFIEDPELRLNGYQANFKELATGLFLFTHRAEGCGSTLAVKAGHFFHLYNGPVFTEQKTEGEDCPEHCLYQDDLERCYAKCECTFVREIISTIVKTKQKIARRCT
ncbi:MAG: hypothetical protein GF315_08075 [candidate division Zixibacteria bacterium]|nr:hypothetical protein [candidate division Zixibacteria bacterium]